jgi:hypothetical protein
MLVDGVVEDGFANAGAAFAEVLQEAATKPEPTIPMLAKAEFLKNRLREVCFDIVYNLEVQFIKIYH